MSHPTLEQIAAGVRILKVLASAIKELGSVPSGEFYARVSDIMPLADYEGAINLLVQAKLIRKENNVLIWIGGK